MNVILFDTNRTNYYPLSYTRPISEFLIGIMTIKQKWEQFYDSVSVKTDDYLSNKFPLVIKEDNLWINAKTIPSSVLKALISNGLRPLLLFRSIRIYESKP